MRTSFSKLSGILELWQTPARLSKIIAFLLLATSLVLVLHYSGPQRQLDLKNTYGQQAFIYDDRPRGGKSVADYIKSPGDGFLCKLVDSNIYKYCGYGINFQDHERDAPGDDNTSIQYVDLSRFTQLYIDMDYEGPAAHVPFGIRTLLSDDAYQYIDTNVEPNTLATYRVAASSLDRPYTLALKRINMSTRWMTDKKIPGSFAKPDLTRVSSFGIQIPSSFPQGTYRFEIRKLTLTGPWIAADTLYASIFFFWTGFIALLSLLQLRQIRKQKIATRSRIKELSAARDEILNVSRVFEEIAHHDQLTGLLNRQGFKDGAGEHLEANPQAKFTIILLDLDHFKQINDSYGHNKGDDILAVAARCIKSQVRSADICARWGGEEFLIACPETCDAEAIVIAEKIRKALKAYRDSEIPSLQLTGSFGIAEHTPRDSVIYTIERADTALYEAKERGRDCYVVAKPSQAADT